MKLTKSLLFAFLALCLVLTLTGCDSGGGGGGGGSSAFDEEFKAINGGTGRTYIVTDFVDRDPAVVADFTVVDGKGIKFKTQGGETTQWEIYIKIFLNDNNKFASTEIVKIDGETLCNAEFTGTWALSGTSLTMTATKEKDLDSGETEDCNVEVKTELSDGDNTMTETGDHGESAFKLIFTKQ